MPGAHARHDAGEVALGVGEYVSSGQDAHAALELAPTTGDHVPAGHASQRVAFAAAWYEPARHSSHVPLVVFINEPAGQGVHRVAPGPDVKPTRQGVHAEAPAADAWVPAAQGEQEREPLTAANEPGAHRAHCVSPE